MKNNNLWIIALGIIVLGTILNLFKGPETTPEPNRNSFEHRYATERMKLEGYNQKEAQQAADAIIKFHNAQKKR